MVRERNAVTLLGTSVGTLPPSVDLTMYQGDDFFLDVHVDDTQVPVDLTGYTVKSVARAKLGDTTVLATFIGTVTDPTTVRLHMTASESAKLVDKAVWDVQVADPAGLVTTLAYGVITLQREVTT